MAKTKQAKIALVSDDDNPSVELKNRETDEIIIGLTGPVGSGVTTTSRILKKILEADYKYKVTVIKVSDLIIQSAKNVGAVYTADVSSDQRIKNLQGIGNTLRQTFGDNYLAEKCVEQIARERLRDGYNKGANDILTPQPRRSAYIIDSLKNPAEYSLLKDVYGDIFWMFGVFSPESVRRDRLLRDGAQQTEIQSIVNRDEEEGVSYGQRVRKTIEHSDFFLRNDGLNDGRISKVIERFLSIIFGVGVNTPTRDEAAMFTAVTAASSSACLSRQVGAAVYSNTGELIGKGANDVPKFGGGLYKYEDEDSDNRCFKYGGKICHNDNHKDKLYQAIFQDLRERRLLSDRANYSEVLNSLRNTDIRNLIEYSRAVHAEMDAIISVGRAGNSGLAGGTLYCTTFPCHSCARHIVASGLRRVIYIEPYPKSLALDLHKDAISVKESEADKFVVFLQYEGVAPKMMVRLFKEINERKLAGKLVERDKGTAIPHSRSPLDGFSTREQIVVQRLQSVESAALKRLSGESS